MDSLIDFNWRPAKKTSEILLNKYHYSQEQLNDIGKKFLERFGGQTISNASTTFSNMVRSSGSAHNTPKPDLSAQVEREEKQVKARANRSKQPEAKLQAVKSNDKPFTREEAIIEYEKRRL